MKIIIDGNRAVADFVLNARSASILAGLEGHRKWRKDGKLSLESTPHNINRIKTYFPDIEIIGLDPTPIEGFEEDKLPSPYHMKTMPFKHQQIAYDLCKDKRAFALFMEQGTGKSKVAIDKTGHLFLQGKITAMLVVSLKGVHRQWVETQIPLHLSDEVDYMADTWEKKPIKERMFITGSLKVFSTYIDAIGTKSGFDEALKFIKHHQGKVLMVVDESQSIKTPKTKRTIAAKELGAVCHYRMIMTGTPLTKSVEDLWSQYEYLDEAILEHRYITTFRSEYCIMGGYCNREIVGQRNVDLLQSKIAPYTYRVTKDEALDLPEKLYSEWTFDLTDEQKAHYRSLKTTLMTQLDNGQVATVANAAVLITRLQQLSCGVLLDADGNISEMNNPRLDELLLLLGTIEGKVIIWARFSYDIKVIKEALGDKAVSYYGDTPDQERLGAVDRFLNDDNIAYFVSNPAAGGTGLNLQGKCHTAIYYSNGFNAVHRWQSEDRIHRIGTTDRCQYYDMIAKGTVDRHILANLKHKKSVSDLTLNDIREMLEE